MFPGGGSGGSLVIVPALARLVVAWFPTLRQGRHEALPGEDQKVRFRIGVDSQASRIVEHL